MAVIVTCDDPAALLVRIKKGIKDGDIDTWKVDSDGDFSHSPEQWRHKAWLRPRVEEDRIIFNILKRKDLDMSKLIYGIYHGRFIEMLLMHFDNHFKRASATALPSSGDVI